MTHTAFERWQEERLRDAAPDLLAALDAIAQAFDCPTRDRFGRINQMVHSEPLRQLMLKYEAPNGMRDRMDQAVFVARAAIAKATGGKNA